MNDYENKILIRGLTVSACHGVLAHEKVNPQTFVFDADLYADFYDGAKNDDISSTVNYATACDLLSEIAVKNSYNLIETLAYMGVDGLFKAFPLKKVSLTVYKPQAPVAQKFENLGVSVTAEKERAYLSLGSSEGNRKEYLERALKMLDETLGVTVKKISSFIETEPYGGVAENKFLNCAAEVETFLSPQRLLKEIHRIERECGRVRKKRWGDRTLDIDVIFFGKLRVDENDLTIPHPEYFKREFVLKPLSEIAPDFVCPLKCKKVEEIYKNLKEIK